MAPISPEIQAITSCVPHHFGPTVPEVNTAWFKLYLYKAARSGPNSRLYSRGRRVVTLSKLFQQSQNVKLSTWGKEAMVLSTTQLLPVLNEALLESPVLVQSYSLTNSAVPTIVDVPFPIEADDQEPKGFSIFNIISKPSH